MKKTVFFIAFCLIANFVKAQQPKDKEVDLKEYLGEYKMDTFFEKAKITMSEGSIYAEMDANGSNKLLKEPNSDTFKSTSSYGSIFIFLRDSTGKVSGLKLKIMDNEILGKKLP